MNKKDANQILNAMHRMKTVCSRQTQCTNCPAGEAGLCSMVKDLHFAMYPPRDWKFPPPLSNV